MYLNEKQLMQVSGGGYGLWAAIAGVIAFIIGIADGFLNPVKCNQ